MKYLSIVTYESTSIRISKTSTSFEEWLKNVFDSNINEKKNTLKTRGIAISYDIKKK